MFRRIMLVAGFGVLVGVVGYGWFRHTAAEAAPAKDAAQAPLVHAVILYLKPEAPAGTADGLVSDAHKMLAKIPTVRALWAGKPADKAGGFVVKDYHAALLLTFDNADGLQKYIDHADHVEYAQKYRPHFDKVLVYDFVNQK